MILRRLANSFRKQDWFTVVLEVMIVVVGIFIGLQVDDWNQRRLDNVKEQAILESLAREFRMNLQEIEFSLFHVEGKQRAALEIMARAAGEAQSDKELDALIGDLIFWWVSPMGDGALQSYLQGGNLAIIRNLQLRELLAAWPGKLAFLRQTQSQDYDTYATELLPYLFEHASIPQINNALDKGEVRNSLTKFIPYGQLPVAPDGMFDHEPLVEDREFINILVQIYWDMEDARAAANQLLSQSLDALALIESAMIPPPDNEEPSQ